MRSRSLVRLFQRRPRLDRSGPPAWPPLPEDLRLDGARIWLRWPRYSDADAIFAYASDDSVSAYMDWSSHSGIEESRRFLYCISQSRTAGREVAFAIIERNTEDLVGLCSLVSQRDPTVAEMGYALRRSAWGQGFMTEAVGLVCPWAFDHLPIHEIFAEVHPSNVRSQRVLEKAGFERDPDTALRSIKGRPIPHYRYRLARGAR